MLSPLFSIEVTMQSNISMKKCSSLDEQEKKTQNMQWYTVLPDAVIKIPSFKKKKEKQTKSSSSFLFYLRF